MTGTPGIRRLRRGRGFSYVRPGGKTVGPRVRRRIEGLAIPPAWQDVWICPDPRGHIQATGIDARGRKQYIYHPAWRQARADEKFDRLEAFGHALPALRHAVEADLGRPGLPREKVVASVVRIMEQTFVRVGSDEYARDNGSYGASTLEGEHIHNANRHRVVFRFPAKSGKVQQVELEDPRIAQVVRRCNDLPGQRLFEYEDDEGSVCEVDSKDVNEYVREAMDGRFSSKDFRTWSASALMLHLLREAGARPSRRKRQHVVRHAVRGVAKALNNTPAVCRRSYIHPAVVEAYLDGTLDERLADPPAIAGLWSQERRLLALIGSYR